MMKKFIPILVIAAGAAAYLITKKKKSEAEEEVKIITLDDFDDENPQPETDEEGAEQEPKAPEETARLSIEYPYLKTSFIEETLRYGENFDAEYPSGSTVRINHVAKFDRVEDLIAFVQSARRKDYLVQEAEEENTILVVKEIAVEEGTILTDVFQVANQVCCLDGEYFGFQIDKL